MAKFFLELIEIVLIAGGLFLTVNTATARVRVESISMEPNLYEGEFVVVNRLAYRWGTPERGDIIVFYFPENPKKRYIKRVIGIEGDLVSVADGQVYVNGDPLFEPYLATAPNYTGEWRVESGELFVLGDNRNNSNDSKNWGNLKLEAVIGKAIFIYWPPGDLGLIPHYDLMQNASY
ncbi:MAG: signal peptidase I [Chloroflexi bacterium RBG_16_48_8]|nr:MAG: signal peptidase I [Chloroflexi bacterium RBG_16_48_8]